jgi:cell division protein FtsQ
VSIDPRLAERRQQVAEDHAKRNVRRTLRFLALVGFGGLVVWFTLSPYLSVATVVIEGARESDTAGILAAHSVEPGTPMILLRIGQVTEALEADPWVVAATVSLRWPDEVTVEVVERTPRAWVETSGGWTRRAEDGVAVPSPSSPDNSMGWIRLPRVLEEDAADSDLILGSIEFLVNLPPELARLTAVRFEDGELWAVVDGYQVRLGRAIEMREKALSLATLLGQDIPKTAIIVMIAPTHPSYLPASGAADTDRPGGEEEG